MRAGSDSRPPIGPAPPGSSIVQKSSRKEAPRPTTRPRASSAIEPPSKTRLSLPPTRLQETSGTPARRAICPMNRSRRRSLPSDQGEAERFAWRSRSQRRQLRDRIGRIERPLPESLVVPDVLADRHADAGSRDPEHERPACPARSSVPRRRRRTSAAVASGTPRSRAPRARGDRHVEDGAAGLRRGCAGPSRRARPPGRRLARSRAAAFSDSSTKARRSRRSRGG